MPKFDNAMLAESVAKANEGTETVVLLIQSTLEKHKDNLPKDVQLSLEYAAGASTELMTIVRILAEENMRVYDQLENMLEKLKKK